LSYDEEWWMLHQIIKKESNYLYRAKIVTASLTIRSSYQSSDWIFVIRKINMEFEQAESQKRKIKRIAKR
jgi:hypothetical protein